MKKFLTISFIALILVLGIVLTKKQVQKTPTSLPFINKNESKTPSQKTESITTVAENLEIPWGLAFLPDGRILVTERPGGVRIINNQAVSDPIAQIPVNAVGEGGLHGIAIDPNYSSNNILYMPLYSSYSIQFHIFFYYP